jgi:DNA-directed RNA polymerase subunit beta'
MLRIDDEARVRTITLDRADALNAFNEALYDATTEALLAAAEDRAAQVEAQYHRGQLDDVERHRDLENIWRETRDQVSDAMAENFPERNPVWMMVKSGARGNLNQISQICYRSESD